eukprot:jgi/Mesen1/6441/ME000033S05727
MATLTSQATSFSAFTRICDSRECSTSGYGGAYSSLGQGASKVFYGGDAAQRVARAETVVAVKKLEKLEKGGKQAGGGLGFRDPMEQLELERGVRARAVSSPSAVLGIFARGTKIVTSLAFYWAGLSYDHVVGRADEMVPKRAAELRNLLCDLGPSFIKAGQVRRPPAPPPAAAAAPPAPAPAAAAAGGVLANRPDIIREDYMNELCILQDDVPAFPSQEAFAIMEKELGQPLEQVFSKVSPSPVAAASLGQVYRATLRETGEEVAIKLLEFGLFHGDPHPGNIFAMQDGRIAYVDFGNVAELSQFLNLSHACHVLRGITRKFNQLVYNYPIRIPERFSLVAYPYVANRLLTDPDPALRERLIQVLFKDNIFQWKRLENLIQLAKEQVALSNSTGFSAREEATGLRFSSSSAAKPPVIAAADCLVTALNAVDRSRSKRPGGLNLRGTIKDGARVMVTDAALRRQLLLAFTEDSRLHIQEIVDIYNLVAQELPPADLVTDIIGGIPSMSRDILVGWSERILSRR